MKIPALLSILILSVPAFAQEYTVEGIVKEDKGYPVQFATVSMLKGNDSSWVETVYSGEDGNFLFTGISKGKYLLDVQSMGYVNMKKSVVVDRNIKGIILVARKDGNVLDEVVIKERNTAITFEQGKTVVNVNKDMKAGANLAELLANMPGVTVSPDGTISMNGKQGIVILINDKPIRLQGRDLMEYIRGINAEQVKKVELITQPSARYDAEGNAGLISVVMDKKKKDGVSGSATGNYMQGVYPYGSANTNLKYQKGKVGVNIMPGYYEAQSFLSSKLVRKSKDRNTGEVLTRVEEESFLREGFSDYNLAFGADYDPNDNTSMSLSGRGLYHRNAETDRVSSVITDEVKRDVFYNNSINNNGHRRGNHELNFFLKHDIDSSNKLLVNAFYYYEWKNMYQKLRGANYDEDMNPVPGGLILDNAIPVSSSVYSVKADYETKPGANTKIEAGVKSSYVTIDDENKFTIYENGQWKNDKKRSNHFLYNENISAAYVDGSAKVGKVEVKAGLRTESTIAHGHELIQDKAFDRKYVSLFPTAYVTYHVDKNNSFECNYGRRLRRPYYRELNPFSRLLSQYNYATGNPNLQPQFTDNIELKHNYKGRLTTSLSYTQNNGVFTDAMVFDNATNINYSYTTNLGKSNISTLAVSYHKQIFNWWGITAYGNVYSSSFSGRLGNEVIYGTWRGCYVSIDTQVTIKNGWYIQLHSRYAGPYRVSPYGIVKGSFFLTSEVTKSILDDTATIKLSTRDPFRWYRYQPVYELPGLETTSSAIYNTQNISLAFTYNFGKKDSKDRHRSIDNEEVKRM